jgi:altronate dehydratase small subunit
MKMNHRAKVLVMSQNDNVGTAAVELDKGETFQVRVDTQREVTTLEKIPFGFKVALQDISEGGNIFKYGEVIGRSTCSIKAGEMVHVHNIAGTRGRGDLEPVTKVKS